MTALAGAGWGETTQRSHPKTKTRWPHPHSGQAQIFHKSQQSVAGIQWTVTSPRAWLVGVTSCPSSQCCAQGPPSKGTSLLVLLTATSCLLLLTRCPVSNVAKQGPLSYCALLLCWGAPVLFACARQAVKAVMVSFTNPEGKATGVWDECCLLCTQALAAELGTGPQDWQNLV